jgi:hypothetical protein
MSLALPVFANKLHSMSTFFTSAQLYSGTGCFVTVEPSFFSGSINVTESGAMTHEMCYNTCAIPGSGYQYFGLYSTGTCMKTLSM